MNGWKDQCVGVCIIKILKTKKLYRARVCCVQLSQFQHIPISYIVCMLRFNSNLDCGLVIPVLCVVCPCARVIACDYVNLCAFLLM